MEEQDGYEEGAEPDEDEEMTTEDVANHADDKIDALIGLLIRKGVITEDEYDKEYNDLFEDEEPEETAEPTETPTEQPTK